MPYVDSTGARIHYRVAGRGFPIVLHTGAGGDARMWEQAGYVDGLTGFQCILLDHRGHGLSSRPPGIENHTVDCYASDVLAVLDAEDIDVAAFWGYSAGAWPGYELAARYRERIATLITLGSVPDTDYAAPEVRAHYAEYAAEVRREGIAAALGPMDASEEGMPVPEWFWRQMVETDPEMFALELEGTRDWQGPSSLLPDIKVPVLLLVGSREDPEDSAAVAVRRLQNGRRVVIPGLGHIGAFLAREALVQEVVPFLTGLTVGTGSAAVLRSERPSPD